MHSVSFLLSARDDRSISNLAVVVVLNTFESLESICQFLGSRSADEKQRAVREFTSLWNICSTHRTNPSTYSSHLLSPIEDVRLGRCECHSEAANVRPRMIGVREL